MGVQYEDKSKEYLRKVEAAADGEGGGLDRATVYLASKMANSMPGAGASVLPGTGGDTGVRAEYVPSRPGQPPGVRTNRLRGSLTNARVATLRWAAGTNVDYARHLEFGTVNMPPRPFMRPALRNNRAGIQREFNKGFERKMGGGA